jgi:hypothetical protein
MRIVFEDLVKTVAETQIVAPITRLELLVGLAGGLLTAHFIEILHRQDYNFLNMEELCHEGFAVRGCALASNEKHIRVARLQLRISRVFYVLRVLAIVMAAVVTFPADILPDDAREKFAHLVQIEVPCITNAVAFLSVWVATVVICIVFNMFGRFVCHMVIDHQVPGISHPAGSFLFSFQTISTIDEEKYGSHTIIEGKYFGSDGVFPNKRRKCPGEGSRPSGSTGSSGHI